jgi:hypothetical protein
LITELKKRPGPRKGCRAIGKKNGTSDIVMNYVTIYRMNHLTLLPRITPLLRTASGKDSDITCVASRETHDM